MNRPNSFLSASLLSLVLSGCVAVPAPRSVPVAPSIQAFVDAEIEKPPFENALWGVLIEDEAGNVLAMHNPSTLMMPASNRKVLVSAFAASCLGLETRLPTELWIEGEVADGVIEGDVVLRGGGDPSLGGRYESDRDLRLMPFVEALRSRGVSLIRGDLIADVSLFSREIIPGSWKNNNLGASYAAPVDALAFNENVIGHRTVSTACGEASTTTDPNFPEADLELECGSSLALDVRSTEENDLVVRGTTGGEPAVRSGVVAVEEPALYAAEALADLFEREGIELQGRMRINAEPRAWRERLAVIESPPVYFLLTTVLKNSQNLYAEMLFRASARGPAPIGYDDARRVEEAFLTAEAGVGQGQFWSADGSGLSPENMVTPEAMVDVFRYLYEPARRNVFHSLLATPGEGGTLRRRLAGLEERMRGKTGTINQVSALSGYVLMPDGSARFFSIIVNHHLSNSDMAEAAIDRIVQRIAMP